GSAFTDEQREAIVDRAERAAEVPGVADAVDPFAAEAERAENARELEEGREEIEAGQAELDAGREAAEAAGMLEGSEEFFDGQQAEIDAGLERIEGGEALMEMSSGFGTVSEDGDTAQVMVAFTDEQMDVPQETRDAVMAVFEDDPVPGTTVDFN